jgi:ABC-type glycerol-3-phosphate transport system substrate-binding protein
MPPPGRDIHTAEQISRRAALGSALAAASALAAPAIAQTRERVARVWGEPGPYVGVFTNGLNEWAQRNAPGLHFEAEQIAWDQVYVKLTTDLAARRPPAQIHLFDPTTGRAFARGEARERSDRPA